MRKVFIPLIGVALLSVAFIFVFSDNRGEASSAAQIDWDREGTAEEAQMEFTSPILNGWVEVYARHVTGEEFGVPFEHNFLCIEGPTSELCEPIPPGAMDFKYGQGRATVDADLSCGKVKFRLIANASSGQFRETESDSASGESEQEQGRYKRTDVISGEVCGFNLNLAEESEGQMEISEFKEKY